MAEVRTLSQRLLILLLTAGLCGAALAGLLHFGGEYAIDCCIDSEDYRQSRTEKRVASLQRFIDKNQLSSSDRTALMDWCDRQPLLLMEISREDKLIFSSAYSAPEELSDRELDAVNYDWYSYYLLRFTDGPAELLIYSDETYLLRTWMLFGVIVCGVLVFLLVFLHGVRRIVDYIRLLCVEVEVLETGDLDHPVTVRGRDELGRLAGGLDSMRAAFRQQLLRQTAAFESNQAMITGMSHDLRTPLTKLMLYMEILRNGKLEDEGQRHEYMDRIAGMIGQIKELADNILQYSIQPKEDLFVNPEPMAFKAAFHDPLSEMAAYLSQRDYIMEVMVDWPQDTVLVHVPYVVRVMNNITSNIERYADSRKPIRVMLVRTGPCIGLIFENRIDRKKSRSHGTGVGLANVRSMMSHMGGSSLVEKRGSTFVIHLWFQRVGTDGCADGDIL